MIQRTTNCVLLATHCGTGNYDVIQVTESDILRCFVPLVKCRLWAGLGRFS
ncbi:hypothetical protein M23134_03949 [Microscilla marina ATCC 23134]|uniref:Uncharacterized protein n=1 Tax=Microscilla marina ATCC 23134 TaxID=313606 RepID=A1ZML7_MICM2|nr:hypothetical protein M23134_03949 [Microscilla marina ATCC 23134]